MRNVMMTAAFGAAMLTGSAGSQAQADQHNGFGEGRIRHVLLISIDGMHSVDFANCIAGSYCPSLAGLAETGATFTLAQTSKPSDSFPGLTALVTGGSPRSTGAFYDVSYDRSLSPPAKTTPYGIQGGPTLCPSVVGTQIGFDEEIDIDLTRLDAGGGIDPGFLPRDPKNNCAPVYPHSFIRVNTIFEVVKAGGGYTAWTDKHQSYELTNGHSGKGVDDFFAPEINSFPVPIPQVAGCNPLPDPASSGSGFAWTDSFGNIRCYDTLKVQAILNQIDGKDHTGTLNRPVPNVFGMNFQAVSVGQKLVETINGTTFTGGYLDNVGTPSQSLLTEIQYVDSSIGRMVAELKKRGLYESTAIMISAKHGQSPIDPKRLLRIPHDAPSDAAPSEVLTGAGIGVAQALEDDISVLWLAQSDPATTISAVGTLEANAAKIGANGGEIYSGALLDRLFNDPATDPRTPNIIVQPNIGVVYTGGGKKVAEHGGFAFDDTNVMMLVANPAIEPVTISSPVETAQIAPTILAVLGLDPGGLVAVQKEGTQVLPGLGLDTTH
jgi:hypothetical protein